MNGGLSRTRLDRMHDVMANKVEHDELPGLVSLVSRRGEVHVDAIGTQAFADPTPMRRDTIFRISSMTKPITAVATMIPVEECKLQLDEPVDRWLPELADREVLKRLDGPLDDTVPARRSITVRDLLTFRMGFGQMIAPSDAYPILQTANEQQIGMGPPNPSAMPAPDEWMRRLGQLPLMHQPGERWMYNTGSDVLPSQSEAAMHSSLNQMNVITAQWRIIVVCRNIKPLFNFEPPATEDEIREAALQFVRKVSGMNAPSKSNEAAFFAAVDEITAVSSTLLTSLQTNALPKNRADEAAKARVRAARRFS